MLFCRLLKALRDGFSGWEIDDGCGCVGRAKENLNWHNYRPANTTKSEAKMKRNCSREWGKMKQNCWLLFSAKRILFAVHSSNVRQRRVVIASRKNNSGHSTQQNLEHIAARFRDDESHGRCTFAVVVIDRVRVSLICIRWHWKCRKKIMCSNFIVGWVSREWTRTRKASLQLLQLRFDDKSQIVTHKLISLVVWVNSTTLIASLYCMWSECTHLNKSWWVCQLHCCCCLDKASEVVVVSSRRSWNFLSAREVCQLYSYDTNTSYPSLRLFDLHHHSPPLPTRRCRASSHWSAPKSTIVSERMCCWRCVWCGRRPSYVSADDQLHRWHRSNHG